MEEEIAPVELRWRTRRLSQERIAALHDLNAAIANRICAGTMIHVRLSAETKGEIEEEDKVKPVVALLNAEVHRFTSSILFACYHNSVGQE